MQQIDRLDVVPASLELAGKLLLRPEEGAELLSLPRAKIYELMASGKLRSLKIGKSRRIPMIEIERFITAEMEAQCA